MIGKILFMVWILGPGGIIYSKSYMVGLPVPCVVGKTRSIILEKKVALILECQVFKGITHWSIQPNKKEGNKNGLFHEGSPDNGNRIRVVRYSFGRRQSHPSRSR